MNNKFRSLIKDTFIFALGSVGSKIILFLLVPLYTNYLSKEEYGIADLVFTVGQLIVPFVSIVIFDAVIRFALSKYENKEDVILVGFIVGLIASVLTILITPFFSLYDSLSPWRWYLTAYVIINIFCNIEFNYLKSKDLNKLFASLSVLQTLLLATFNVFFLIYKNAGIKGYLVSTIAAGLIVGIISFINGNIIQDLKNASFSPRLAKEMILYSAPLIFNNISWWVIHSSDKIMVETMISAGALGLYTVSAKIPSLINVGVSVFQQAWGISTVKEIENDNDTYYYSQVFRYLFLVASMLCIIFVSIIKVLMPYYVGDSFIDSWKYVPLLLVSAVFGAISAYYGSLYGALKKSINNMLSTVVAAIINLALNFLLINKIGVWGAVISTLVAYLVLSSVRMLDVKRYLDIHIDYYHFIFVAVLIIVHAILVSFNYHVFIISTLTLLLFCIINRNELKNLIKKRRKEL